MSTDDLRRLLEHRYTLTLPEREVIEWAANTIDLLIRDARRLRVEATSLRSERDAAAEKMHALEMLHYEGISFADQERIALTDKGRDVLLSNES